uniref:Uncharacterized protein n=1 Tax=Myotis myotis TaxID=51298 RepID=A0A7J7UPE3_MYOMY|nr:hypothetical protein mMyoMyo1_008591 [Myotis myotis]
MLSSEQDPSTNSHRPLRKGQRQAPERQCGLRGNSHGCHWSMSWAPLRESQVSPGALAASLSQHLLGYPLTYDTWVRSRDGEGGHCVQPGTLGSRACSAPGLWGLNATCELLGSQGSLLGDMPALGPSGR